jgi:putative NADPH-quinone reductase
MNALEPHAVKHIVVIDGHPDARASRFGHLLADAYVQGAQAAGHEIQRIVVAELDFPLLRTQKDYETGAAPTTIRDCQEMVAWAGHLVILFPLWMGEMPALLKAFLEQLLRPGFAYRARDSGRFQKLLTGKSAHIVVTMGMPAFMYRWYFGAHGLKNLKRNILGMCGVRPVRASLFGMIEGVSDARRRKWLEHMRALGRNGR